MVASASSSRRIQLGFRLTFVALLVGRVALVAADIYLMPWLELIAADDRIGAARYPVAVVTFATELIVGGCLLLAAAGLWRLARAPGVSRAHLPARLAMVVLAVDAVASLSHPVLRHSGWFHGTTSVEMVMYRVQTGAILIWVPSLVLSLMRQLRSWGIGLSRWVLAPIVVGTLWAVSSHSVWQYFLWRSLLQLLSASTLRWIVLSLDAAAGIPFLLLLAYASLVASTESRANSVFNLTATASERFELSALPRVVGARLGGNQLISQAFFRGIFRALGTRPKDSPSESRWYSPESLSGMSSPSCVNSSPRSLTQSSI